MLVSWVAWYGGWAPFECFVFCMFNYHVGLELVIMSYLFFLNTPNGNYDLLLNPWLFPLARQDFIGLLGLDVTVAIEANGYTSYVRAKLGVEPLTYTSHPCFLILMRLTILFSLKLQFSGR